MVKPPIRLDLTFKNYRPPELLAYLPNVQRTNSHTVEFIGQNMNEASRFVEFALYYSPELAP